MGAAGALDGLQLTGQDGGVAIPVRAVPRASRDALDGVVEGALRVRLAAPPVEGAANKALVAFLAGVFGVPKRDVSIAAGEHGRRKLVRVAGLDAAEARRRLALALAPRRPPMTADGGG